MKNILLFLSFLVFTTGQLMAQCTGNIGENIFTEGDFGVGAANILIPDPGIAPGYTYAIAPPPNDGSYCITNNTSSWGSFASNWADIEDNSSNPNGYMMVVNASFAPGLFYEQEVDDLCENTLYVFSADVYNLLTSIGGIQPNISFLIDGAVVYQTGDIPENEQWNTYGFTFTTDPGQTSVTLALQNNAPGGNGNDLALDNIEFRPCGPEALILPETIEYVCEDGSPIELEATIIGNQYPNAAVQWQQSFDEGMTWQNIPGATNLTYIHTDLTGGFYYYRYLLANGTANLSNSKCRVVSNEKIIRVVPKFYTIVDTLCEGLSFSLGNSELTTSGIYTDSLFSFTGCDSILTVDLTILPDAGIDVIFDINPSCPGEMTGTILLDTILNGTAPYTILIDGAPSMSEGNIANLSTGSFFYEITDYFGCTFEELVTIEEGGAFTVELGENWLVELGESIEIRPIVSGPASEYIWQPADLIDCPVDDCETLIWTPPSSTWVYLEAVSATSSCIGIDSVYVEVNPVRKVYLPNIFSPNFDGINDYFTVFAEQPNVVEVDELLVFDRWGNLVFERRNFQPNDETLGWDGRFKGERVVAGSYVYVATVRFLDGVLGQYEGDVVILR